MKKLKLAITIAFLLAAAISFHTKTVKVAGQSGNTLDAPTGVIASDLKYNNKVTVYWNAIRGATTYRIFRNSSNEPNTASDIGTSVTLTFLDTTAPAGQQLFYWVRAENSSTVSTMSASDAGTRATTANTGNIAPLAPPAAAPAGNPLTAAKIYLGKALFWDEQLSSTRTVACGTCHHSSSGGVDPRSPVISSLNPGPDQQFNTADDVLGSRGVPSSGITGTYSSISLFGINEQTTARRSMSYLNAAYPATLFWDGRATGTFRDPITNAVVLNAGGALESQAIGPPVSSAEMAHSGRDWTDVAARVAVSKPLALSPSIPAGLSTWLGDRSYPELFQEAFGTNEVTPSRIAMAIASFERTLYTDQAPIDLAASGITTLSASAQRGRNIFAPLGCGVCHGGNLFTDNAFHNIGVRPQSDDPGRFAITGSEQNRSEFRTPSLRNVALRGSYFHNGRFTTLQQVIDFYDRGGDFDAPNLAVQINPLGLNQGQKNDLIAFLGTLTDPRVESETPPFDRPQLYSESNLVPQITGTGRSGSGNVVPAIKAISPPIAGNPNFVISLSGALGGANAVLVIDQTDPGTPATIPTSGSLAHVGSSTQNTGSGNGWTSVIIPLPQTNAVVGKTFYARWYINDPSAANGFSVSPAAKFTVFGNAASVAGSAFDDFDGDGKTDVSVFRPTTGNWYLSASSDSSFSAANFGISSDKLVPADYDGDGKTDIAVYRNGVWYVLKSRDGFFAAQFGSDGDLPQTGDFDGDGIADLAVFRPSNGNWYIQRSRDGFSSANFGLATDRPVAADYDADGKTDIAVYRDGVWYLMQSQNGFAAAQFGLAEDKPVIGDYDGDGKDDLAVFRPSTASWYVLKSSNGQIMAGPFGLSDDIPTPGDFDGDGKNDLAVFRPSTGVWYILSPNSGSFRAQQFGTFGDKPVPSSVVP